MPHAKVNPLVAIMTAFRNLEPEVRVHALALMQSEVRAAQLATKPANGGMAAMDPTQEAKRRGRPAGSRNKPATQSLAMAAEAVNPMLGDPMSSETGAD
jgi:hypothetical protein